VQKGGALPFHVSDALRAIRGEVAARLHQFVFLLRGSGFPVPDAAEEMAHHAFNACWGKHLSRKSVAIAAKRRMVCALGSAFVRRANADNENRYCSPQPNRLGKLQRLYAFVFFIGLYRATKLS